MSKAYLRSGYKYTSVIKIENLSGDTTGKSKIENMLIKEGFEEEIHK
jgi:hypothetical protein